MKDLRNKDIVCLRLNEKNNILIVFPEKVNNKKKIKSHLFAENKNTHLTENYILNKTTQITDLMLSNNPSLKLKCKQIIKDLKREKEILLSVYPENTCKNSSFCTF